MKSRREYASTLGKASLQSILPSQSSSTAPLTPILSQSSMLSFLLPLAAVSYQGAHLSQAMSPNYAWNALLQLSSRQGILFTICRAAKEKEANNWHALICL